MTFQQIFSIWAMALLMISMTVLVAAIIWVMVDGIKRYKE